MYFAEEDIVLVNHTIRCPLQHRRHPWCFVHWRHTGSAGAAGLHWDGTRAGGSGRWAGKGSARRASSGRSHFTLKLDSTGCAVDTSLRVAARASLHAKQPQSAGQKVPAKRSVKKRALPAWNSDVAVTPTNSPASSAPHPRGRGQSAPSASPRQRPLWKADVQPDMRAGSASTGTRGVSTTPQQVRWVAMARWCSGHSGCVVLLTRLMPEKQVAQRCMHGGFRQRGFV